MQMKMPFDMQPGRWKVQGSWPQVKSSICIFICAYVWNVNSRSTGQLDMALTKLSTGPPTPGVAVIFCLMCQYFYNVKTCSTIAVWQPN